MIENWGMFQMRVADDNRFIRVDVTEKAEHCLFRLCELRQVRVNISQIREVNSFLVDQDPLLCLVAYGKRMLFHWRLTGNEGLNFVALTVDYIIAKSFKLFIIKVIDAIELLQADQTCLTCRDFFDYSRSTEFEVANLLGCICEPICLT